MKKTGGAMLTYVIFFLVLTIVAGGFALIMAGPLGLIMFVVALLLLGWSAIMYMRERSRGTRR
jgi:hypothetical protein